MVWMNDNVDVPRCVSAEMERMARIEAGELDEEAAMEDPVPAITKVRQGVRQAWVGVTVLL